MSLRRVWLGPRRLFACPGIQARIIRFAGGLSDLVVRGEAVEEDSSNEGEVVDFVSPVV